MRGRVCLFLCLFLCFGDGVAWGQVSDWKWSDFIWPRRDSYVATWEVRYRMGVHQVLGEPDGFGPMGIPMELSPYLDFYDRVKRVRMTPFVLSFRLLENGRNAVFESFSYGFELGSVEFDVFVRPWIHLHYDVGLYRTGSEHQVAGAGLYGRLGVRIPVWYRSTVPIVYEQEYAHFIIFPFSLITLGRLDKPNLDGVDPLRPVINGHVGFEWSMPLLRWFQWSGNAMLHYSYTQQETFYQNVPVRAPASMATAMTEFRINFGSVGSLRLQGHLKLPIAVVSKRANLYGIYFDRYPSVGLDLLMVFNTYRLERKDGVLLAARPFGQAFLDLFRKKSAKEPTRTAKKTVAPEPFAVQKVEQRAPRPFFHSVGLHFSAIQEQTAVDNGVYPELRYRLQHSWWLDVELGVRYGPPEQGDLLRYFLMGSVHLPIPGTRDAALRVGWMHSTFTDIQRGDNILLILSHIDTKHFAFSGGLGMRFLLTDPATANDPFFTGSDYVETTLLFDFRARLEFVLAGQREHKLQAGISFMNYLESDILTSNVLGYQLFAKWMHPTLGHLEVAAGIMSYSLLDLAGFYGRYFLRANYTYTFGQ